ncbi:hypothetical protein C8J56DRAFT_799242 [Mycena floridula]|nr:hypothetical protein C8J56DRAFT_799242 [Mycena floridula]
MENRQYLRLSVSPATTDLLSLRQAIQVSLAQMFGEVMANVYLDILWVAEEGTAMIIGVAPNEAKKVLAALPMTMSLVKQSSFLPSLLSTGLVDA